VPAFVEVGVLGERVMAVSMLFVRLILDGGAGNVEQAPNSQ